MTRWRRPAWWSVLLTVLAAALFVRLGIWQLDRAAYKETLVQRYATAAAAPPVAFDKVAAAPPADAFPRVAVQGHYLADRAYLLDNPHHDARGGVEVYVPLALTGDARLLLVDLGFLPGDGRDQTPQLPALPTGEVALHGLYLPPPGVGLELGGDALARQRQWPKTSIYLDLSQVADDLRRPLYPRVLALDADPSAVFQRVHAFDFSAMPPSRHRAYAFQWFSFALAVWVIFLVLHRKRRPPTCGQPMTTPNPSDLKASRLKLLAIMAVFAVPIIAAGVLTFTGWQPSGEGYGRPIQPQRNFVDEHVQVSLADGREYAWRDPAEPRMTLVALAGPGCAVRCFEALTGMAKAWVMLSRNQKRLRLLYVGAPPADPARLGAVKGYWMLGHDSDGKLAAFTPTAPDSVSALLVESNGTALAYYPAGFDGTGLLRDLHKVIK